MWSATGQEFSRVIDPQLKWKISSNCKQRALRKARTFTQDNGKRSSAKDLKDIEDLFDKASKREGDMLVSESEKFGVSLLGRRFSDNLETFPIKKRIISLLPSQSTPNILSSSGFNDYNQDSHVVLFQNNQESLKHDELHKNPSHGVELDHMKESTDEKRSLTHIDEYIGDSADFSGISILAAAACHSSIEKALIPAEVPAVRVNSFEKNPNLLSCIESHKDKDQSSNSELGKDKQEQVAAHFTTVNALYEEPGPLESDECEIEHSGSLDGFTSKGKPEPSRDDRRHWDLNTVMDVWENQSDDYSKCHTPSNVKSSQGHDMVYGNQGSRQDGAGVGVKRVGLISSESEYISYNSYMLEEEMDINHEILLTDCDEGKHSLTETQVCESLQGKCQIKEAEVMSENVPEQTNPEVNGEISCLITTNAYPVESVTHLSSDEDKYGNSYVRFSMKVDAHNTLSHMIIIGNDSHNKHAFDPPEDKKVNAMLLDESRYMTTIDSCNDYSGECHPDDPHIENHQSLSTDVALNATSKKSPAEQLEQDACAMVIDTDDEEAFKSSFKGMTTKGYLNAETAYAYEFGTNQSKDIVFNSQGTSNEPMISRNECISQYEDTSADVTVDGSRSSILSCDSLNASKSCSPFHTNTVLMNSISEAINLDSKGSPAFLISNEECQTSDDVHVKSLEKDSVEEHFDYEHLLNASPDDTDDATGLEKVDYLGEDDSQYEDGELRESVLNSWGEDGAEEVETERVDYGSDCRETDSFEAESDFCSQSDLAVGTTDCKHEGRLNSTYDGNRLLSSEDSQTNCLQTHFSVKDFPNVSYGEGDVGVDTLNDSGKVLDANVATEVPTRAENRFLASNLPNGADGISWKASQPSSSRMKSSGWDKLPKSEDAAVSLWNIDDASVASSINGESARRRMVSSIKRDLISRVEISKSSEATCRKEVFYDRETRLDGRSRSFQSRCRGRGWFNHSDHHGCRRIDISNYHSSPKFSHPVSRNAAAAAVAKVESNGFVVAPDGTIVKGGSLGPGSHLSGYSSKSSTHFHSTRRGSPMEGEGGFCMPSELSNSREFSTGSCFNGRASRYGSRLFSIGHGNRYHVPIPDRRNSSQPLQHPSSRRQRSFSPHRRPIFLSHELVRSPSRSRTRSPHTWTSPRGRNDERINGIPDMKRQSRSPTKLKPQRGIMRQRSMYGGVPAEEFAIFAPPYRNHSSPPHTSKWIDNDRNFRNHLREQEHRRTRGRSPPTRIFLHSNRLDDMDSHGRMKPDEHYEPIYSERFQEYAGYGREPKHDGCGDGRRGRSDRYGVLHLNGNLKSADNMSCLRYDDKVRSHSLRPKSLVFQQRQSPSTFDRSIDTQNEDSPRRIKEEMVHFRHGRDVKSNTDFKPFKVRNTGDNMPLQRRPS